ncbi:MAG TPA: Crp/Fnr family transcriptional regulator [Vicinamibacterales bacterium]|nr:Crp/Fnr family transcriptional regulator [Vicinamibacterales bacterium]
MKDRVSRRRTGRSKRSSHPATGPLRNRLLAALPNDELQRILPYLEVVPLRLRELLHKPGEPIDYVYFPGGGFCSILTVLEDGSMVETAAIGREGLVGLAAAVVQHPMATASMVQGDIDVCYRMTAIAFRKELDRCGPFHAVVSQYAQALMAFVMQSAACNAAHSIEQRFARWLLAAHDRMGTDTFVLTQEFIAMMLGASRSTVSIVAGMLQKAGYITYRRGRVAIVDRRALEEASCECYRTGRLLLAAFSATHSRN